MQTSYNDKIPNSTDNDSWPKAVKVHKGSLQHYTLMT
jgi:hypothetical protein